MSETGKRFLGPADAAAYLGGLNARTVVLWAREGYLPAFPIGEGKRRLWRFLEGDLEAWMLARRHGGHSGQGALHTGAIRRPITARHERRGGITLWGAIGAPVGD